MRTLLERYDYQVLSQDDARHVICSDSENLFRIVYCGDQLRRFSSAYGRLLRILKRKFPDDHGFHSIGEGAFQRDRSILPALT